MPPQSLPYLEILDALPAHIAVLDSEATVVLVNEQWKRFARDNGYRGDDLGLGRNYVAVCRQMWGDDREIADETAAGVAAVLGGKTREIAIEYPCHSPTAQRWYTARISPLPVRGGPGAVVMHTDITQRKLAEHAQRRSEARLTTILNTAVEAIVTMDETGAITMFNDAAEAMFGYRRDEVLGRNVKMLMPEPYHSEHDGYVRNYLRTGVARIIGFGREVEGRRRNGATFPLHLAVGEWRLNGLKHFTGIMRDLTERERMEQELSRAQRLEALGRLAGGIAHDFNNLLLPIISLSELTMRNLPEVGEARDNLERVLTAARRGKALVDQIFTYSQGKPTQRRAIDLADLAREALALIRTSVPDSVTIEAHLDVQAGTVRGDPTQLHEMIMNLASNAAKAIGAGPGTISLKLEPVEIPRHPTAMQGNLKPGTYARLRVRDTGRGMDEETISRIFDPFFTTERAGLGTGMGLAIVHSIVTGHGGAVTVFSKPGQGATFDIYLSTTLDYTKPRR